MFTSLHSRPTSGRGTCKIPGATVAYAPRPVLRVWPDQLGTATGCSTRRNGIVQTSPPLSKRTSAVRALESTRTTTPEYQSSSPLSNGTTTASPGRQKGVSTREDLVRTSGCLPSPLLRSTLAAALVARPLHLWSLPDFLRAGRETAGDVCSPSSESTSRTRLRTRSATSPKGMIWDTSFEGLRASFRAKRCTNRRCRASASCSEGTPGRLSSVPYRSRE